MVAGLGKSDVPLEEDLIKKRQDFIKTWAEFAADNLDQIFESDSQASTGTTVLFTVPVRNTLFITSAWISAIHEAALGTDTVCNLEIDSTAKRILSILQDRNTADQMTLSFPMPLKVEENSTVQIEVGGVAEAFAGFVGFLVPKRIA